MINEDIMKQSNPFNLVFGKEPKQMISRYVPTDEIINTYTDTPFFPVSKFCPLKNRTPSHLGNFALLWFLPAPPSAHMTQ